RPKATPIRRPIQQAGWIPAWWGSHTRMYSTAAACRGTAQSDFSGVWKTVQPEGVPGALRRGANSGSARGGQGISASMGAYARSAPPAKERGARELADACRKRHAWFPNVPIDPRYEGHAWRGVPKLPAGRDQNGAIASAHAEPTLGTRLLAGRLFPCPECEP